MRGHHHPLLNQSRSGPWAAHRRLVSPPQLTIRSFAASCSVLLLLGAGAGGLLAWFAAATQEKARANRQAAQTRVLRELAGVDVDAAAPGDVLYCANDLVILRGVGRGYGGPFQLAVATDDSGALLGVRVLEHRETPGFGDILAPEAEWLGSFQGGEVDAVTGATVTSTAVINAVARLAERARAEACGP